MVTKEFTFNDLPTVVGELCEKIASLETTIKENIKNRNEVKENTHVLMSVQEACEYLKMPLSTFYYKVKNDGCIILIDSFGNEPRSAKTGVLKKNNKNKTRGLLCLTHGFY